MKILFISTMANSSWGGSEVLWSKMADEYLRLGYDVTASIYNWEKLPDVIETLKSKGLKVHLRTRTHYQSIPNKIKGKLIEKTISKLEFQKLLKLNPDFVFFSQGAAFDLCQPLFSTFIFNLKCPFFCYLSLNTEYEILPYAFMIKQREIFNKAKCVFFVSKRNLETAKRQLCSELSNTMVINNPITFSNITEMPVSKNEQIKFAMVARLDAYVKGHPVVLQILSENNWVNRDWHLNIFGGGEDKKYIVELIKFYNLSHRVTLHGQISDIKEQIWKNNDVLLMPSQYEGCPISLYDAAICERTAIVSDVGGNAEFIIENVNGFVAEAPSVKSFGNAMERFWKNRDRLLEFSKNARNMILNNLDLNPELTVIEKIDKFFKK